MSKDYNEQLLKIVVISSEKMKVKLAERRNTKLSVSKVVY